MLCTFPMKNRSLSPYISAALPGVRFCIANMIITKNGTIVKVGEYENHL